MLHILYKYFCSIFYQDKDSTYELPNKVEFKIARHLPYSNHHRISPSGDPVGTGNYHIAFRNIRADSFQRDEVTTRFIRVSPSDGLPSEHDAMFYPEEITGLRFVMKDDGDFTKLVMPSYDYMVNLNVYGKRSTPAEVVDEIGNIAMPPESTGLFRRRG